ncbi:MAG: hypothetical protein WC455_14535 [Dehalococcoidia bacterium]|jgi:hypothetical protein
MAEHVIKDTKILIGGFDYSPGLNQVGLTLKKAPKPDPAFGDGAQSIALGLQTFELIYSGYLDMNANNQDEEQTNWGEVDTVLTICPENVDVEAIAYCTKKAASETSWDGTIGDKAAFSGAAFSSGQGVVRGLVLASGEKTTTVNGAAVEAGAVGATQYLYGVLHITGVSGTDNPTATVKIQSAPASNFASPTDRIEFTASTEVEAQWATPVAGEITDTFWRAVVTISGTNPSLTVYCVMAIQ